MDSIILIGLSGSGKTSVGRALAKRTHRPFFDTDELVVRAAGQSIPALFAAEGEAGFRARERAAVEQAAGVPRAVIATGGGTVLDRANVAALKRCGMLFWLDRPVEDILRGDLSGRPLLRSPDDLRAMAKRRAPLYRAAADVRLSGGSIAELCDAILAFFAMEEEA